MSRQLDLTVQGVMGTNPSLVRTASGRAFSHMRVATTPSYRANDGWRDGETIWFSVKAWGTLAENIARSLRKGDPVVLVGRLTQETWGQASRVTNVLTLSTAGHDLSRGESRFMRVAAQAATRPEESASGQSREQEPEEPPDVGASQAQEPDAALEDPWAVRTSTTSGPGSLDYEVAQSGSC